MISCTIPLWPWIVFPGRNVGVDKSLWINKLQPLRQLCLWRARMLLSSYTGLGLLCDFFGSFDVGAN